MEGNLKDQLSSNTMLANSHLYDHVCQNSESEKAFARKLDIEQEVVMYVNLLKCLFISTPVENDTQD